MMNGNGAPPHYGMMMQQQPTTSHAYRPAGPGIPPYSMPSGYPPSEPMPTTSTTTTSASHSRHSSNTNAAAKFHQERKQASVFVFPSALANAACQAVVNGACASITDYHAQHHKEYTSMRPVSRPPSNAPPIKSPMSVPQQPIGYNGVTQPSTPSAMPDIKCSTSMPTTPATTTPQPQHGRLQSPAYGYNNGNGPPSVNKPLHAGASNPLLQMERMTQETVFDQKPGPLSVGRMSSPSMAVGSPRGAPPMNGGQPTDATNQQQAPPTTDEDANTSKREAKLAQLKKIRHTMDAQSTPVSNGGAMMPHPGPSYPNAQPGPQHPYPYGVPGPGGMAPGMRPPVGAVFNSPHGPLIMLQQGPMPLQVFQEQQHRHHMFMQQQHAAQQQALEAPPNGRKRKNTRLPASTPKPTMTVPPNSRVPPFMHDPHGGMGPGGPMGPGGHMGPGGPGGPMGPGGYQPQPPPYMAGGPYKMGGSPGQYAQSPNAPGNQAPPPGYHPGMPRMPHHSTATSMGTVNNTYVNANVHVQQLNIQNVQGPVGNAQLTAQSMSMHQQQQNGGGDMNGGGGIPMPGPGGHPAYGGYHPDFARMHHHPMTEPLTNLDSKVASVKMSYFPQTSVPSSSHGGPSSTGGGSVGAFSNQSTATQMTMTSVEMNLHSQGNDLDFPGLNDSDELGFGNEDSGGANDILSGFD